MPRRLAILALCLTGCTPRGPDRDSVTVAYPVGLGTVLPHETADSHSASILANVYEPLVDFGSNLSLEPGLARSWRTTTELDWVFELRAGVRFHDGSPLRPEDVVRALERARDDDSSQVRPELAAVAEIAREGPSSVRLRTRYPFPVLPNRLASVPIFAERSGAAPVGTGPYRLRSRQPTAAAELERFAEYWGKPPALASLRFVVVPGAGARVDAFARGEVDLVTDIDFTARAAATAPNGGRLVSRKGLTVLYLGMDTARERNPHVSTGLNPFRDPRVRQALALALKREALVAGPLRGQGQIAEQIVAPEVFGYEPALPRRAHDPVRARELLAAAGFASGFDVKLDAFDMLITGSDGRDLVATLGAQLAVVGVRLTPRGQPVSELLERIQGRDTALYLVEWVSTSGDFGITAEYLLRSPGAGLGSFNGGGYSNPEVDSLLDEASRTLESSRRGELLRKVARLVHGDLPILPLARLSDAYVVRDGLEFQPRLDRQVRGAEMAWTGSGR